MIIALLLLTSVGGFLSGGLVLYQVFSTHTGTDITVCAGALGILIGVVSAGLGGVIACIDNLPARLLLEQGKADVRKAKSKGPLSHLPSTFPKDDAA